MSYKRPSHIALFVIFLGGFAVLWVAGPRLLGPRSATAATPISEGTLSGTGSCQGTTPLYSIAVPSKDKSKQSLGNGEIYLNGKAYTSPAAGKTYAFQGLTSGANYTCALDMYYSVYRAGYVGGPEVYDCSFTAPSCTAPALPPTAPATTTPPAESPSTPTSTPQTTQPAGPICPTNASYTINIPATDSAKRVLSNEELYLNGQAYTSPAAGKSYTITGLAEGTTYTYSVSAYYRKNGRLRGPEVVLSGSFTTAPCVTSPVLTSIAPSTAVPGSSIKITGAGFLPSDSVILTPAATAQIQSLNAAAVAMSFWLQFSGFWKAAYVTFLDTANAHWSALKADFSLMGAAVASAPITIPATSSDGTTIAFILPAATSVGTYTLAVSNANGQSTSQAFSVVAFPPLAITASASASASGYPVSNMLAGSPTQAWVASLISNHANNFAWVQFDLGREQYVNSISWDSTSTPAPATGLSDYVVLVSDDASAWTPAYAHFATTDQGALQVGPIAINKNARYVRIETTKVGDGSGSAASMSDVQFSTTEPTTTQSYACDVVLSPTSSYQSILHTLRGSASTWTNVCFQPGTYSSPVEMDDAQNIRLLAPQGGVTFSANVPWFEITNLNTPSCTQTNDSGCLWQDNTPYRATFEVDESNNIYIQGITFTNTYQFYDGNSYNPPVWKPEPYWQITESTSEVSTALDLDYVNNTTLDHDTFTSAGKSVIQVTGSNPVIINGGSSSGYYFEIDLEGSNALWAYNMALTSHNLYSGEIGADDYHSVIYSGTSSMTLENSTISTISGRDIFSGLNTAANRLVVAGKTVISGIAAGTQGGWGQINAEEGQEHIFVTGTYPTLKNAFVLDPDGGYGTNSGSYVCLYPSGKEQCSYPPKGE